MTLQVKASAARASGTSSGRLTIGIPTWNRAARLAQQLRLIEPALTPDIELLVCDNASDDDTWAALEGFMAATDKKVRCVRNGANLGADPNYLRVIEAASCEWVWLVGDDDDIDFEVAIPRLLAVLASVDSPIVLLLDEREAGGSARGLRQVTPEEFLQPSNDLLGLQLHQVGRVVCRAAAAQRELRGAHGRSNSLLHAYAPVYGALLHEGGVAVLTLALHPAPRANADARWDLLRGHVGAWKMSLIAFPGYEGLVNARENRVRQKAILAVVVQRLVRGGHVDREDLRWMLRVFSTKGRLGLLLVLASFALCRPLAIGYLLRRHPGFVAQLGRSPQPVDLEY